ncbi:hypothetical protein [Herbaspirillum frisingense]|uniref:Site-specific integrase n=1 Tax=Herbaspirillum frisingense TaxID=92645 RepID=A0ABU1PLX5_9BURK|nr:hypothetical protein [Herbaspirillum frisingense]MDR6586363.1 hypothetical protein [Herbaspirillum frisingense]
MGSRDLPEPSRIQLTWTGERNDVAMVYDLEEERLLLEITDYSLYLLDEELNEKTIRNEVFRLKGFLDFLARHRLSYQEVTDSVLVRFRTEEYQRVIDAKNSAATVLTTNRTVNAKLIRVYKFLYWLEHEKKLIERVIAPRNCPVKSTYNPSRGSERSKRYGRSAMGSRSTDYPKLFKKDGKNGGHTQYEATDDDVQKIAENFLLQKSQHAAQRNILMMDLACEVSWRRGAINSLTCDQFSGLDFLDANHDDYIVIPPSQKFGYQRRFEVPFRLAFRVAEFISIERKKFLSEKGWSEARTKNRIFVSEHRGEPLEDQSISQIFGDAFKVLGHPRGANIHSFRRKFANDLIDQEILHRLDLGLDTTEMSIATTVAFKMGQSNPDSLKPYVNRRLSRMVKRQKKLKENRLETLEEENRALKERIALLEKDWIRSK